MLVMKLCLLTVPFQKQRLRLHVFNLCNMWTTVSTDGTCVLLMCLGPDSKSRNLLVIAGSTILCFHHEEICPNTVLVPARCLRVHRDVQHSWLHQELEDFAQVLPHPCSLTCCREAMLEQCNLCVAKIGCTHSSGWWSSPKSVLLVSLSSEHNGGFVKYNNITYSCYLCLDNNK